MASASDEDRATTSGPDAEIAALQQILIGPARRRLDAIETRLDDPDARAADVGEVLPRVLAEHAHDPALARALAGPLEDAITASVRRNPAPLADALFPVMGPAIRKAVSASLAAMIESLNRTLEHAVSWRSVQWRLEAVRTHRSFAEIVMLKTLLYRVEQVFLIERRSGLLLLHVQPGSAAVADADMVSGMLTAIRDFVGDSFRVGAGDSLEALKVGDLSVRIEPGPRALVAAVVRGTPPGDIRPRLQDAVETIHLQFGGALESWNGDTRAFEDARPLLEACLTSEYRAEERRRPARALWLGATAAALIVLIWGGFWWRDGARQARYLAALDAEPGLTVISADRRGSRLAIAGLRDPLARDPAALLSGTDLPPDRVEARWTPYQSLEPALVLERARQTLRPPDGAALALAGGVLSVSGTAPAAWATEAARIAPLIGGVTAFELDPSTATAVIAPLEATALFFITGSTALLPGQDGALERLRRGLTELDGLARAVDTRFAVALIGHTDAEGSEASNLRLSERRAASARDLLALESLMRLDVTTSGVGSREPAVTGGDGTSQPRNRRVTLRVTPAR